MRISSFLNTCLNYIPSHFQPFALTHFPIIFRPGPWLPGAFLGLNPQAKFSEASLREDALAQYGASYTLARSSPALISGLRRQRVTWGVIRGAMSMPLPSPPQGCPGSRGPLSLLNPSLQQRLNLQVAPNVYSWSLQINSRFLLVFREIRRMVED